MIFIKIIFSFDWFLRLDDDAYVNIDNLIPFLASVNSSEPLYLGNVGFGKHAEDYLGFGDTYCMVIQNQ